MDGNGWKLLELTGNSGNGWKCSNDWKRQEMAGNGWKWLEIT